MSRYVPVHLKASVREQFANCCAYCQTAERLTTTQFEIEHILPRSRGGTTILENLCLACPSCNLLKSDRVEFIDPVTSDRVPMYHERGNDYAVERDVTLSTLVQWLEWLNQA